jgi:hypothetical protein
VAAQRLGLQFWVEQSGDDTLLRLRFPLVGRKSAAPPPSAD